MDLAPVEETKRGLIVRKKKYIGQNEKLVNEFKM